MNNVNNKVTKDKKKKGTWEVTEMTFKALMENRNKRRTSSYIKK